MNTLLKSLILLKHYLKKMTAKFDLYDTTNHLVASFVTYGEALSYKMCIAHRPD